MAQRLIRECLPERLRNNSGRRGGAQRILRFLQLAAASSIAGLQNPVAGVLGAGGGPEPQPGGMKTLSKTDTKNGLDNRGHYTSQATMLMKKTRNDPAFLK